MKKNKETEDLRLKQLIEAFERGEHDSAIRLGSTFTDTYPHNGTGWNIFGLACKNAGNVDKAISIFEFLCRALPKAAMYPANLGNCFLMVGRIEDAITSFKKAITLDERFVNAIEALGLAYTEIDDRDNAKACFSKVISIEPHNQRSLYYLGNMCLAEQNWSEAKEWFRRSDYGLSQSHYLESLLCCEDLSEFWKQLKINENHVCNPLVGGTVAHANRLCGERVVNPFCNEALDFIQVSNLTADEQYTRHVDSLIKMHHSEKSNYRSQDLLTKGKQSSGNLFLRDAPEVSFIKEQIEATLRAYKASYEGSDEGFISNWPAQYELYGWIVSIGKGGSLSAHNHKEGWISGSLYLRMPPADVINKDSGKISFSYCGPRYPKGNVAWEQTTVNVEQNDICIFPSSLFHLTIPFESSEERISLAFDLKPI